MMNNDSCFWINGFCDAIKGVNIVEYFSYFCFQCYTEEWRNVNIYIILYWNYYYFKINSILFVIWYLILKDIYMVINNVLFDSSMIKIRE